MPRHLKKYLLILRYFINDRAPQVLSNIVILLKAFSSVRHKAFWKLQVLLQEFSLEKNSLFCSGYQHIEFLTYSIQTGSCPGLL